MTSITTPITPTRDWEAIAVAYAANDMTVDAICAAHSVGRSSLYHRALSEGWPLRAAMTDGPARRRAREQDLGQRLLDALDRKMTQFERRLAAPPADPAVATSVDDERDARTLHMLVRLFDKLIAMNGKTGAPAKPAAPANAAERGDIDADRIRRALAERLETMQAGRQG